MTSLERLIKEEVQRQKNEIELHFRYYGREIDGFYKDFENDMDTLDSMIYDLETSLRILKGIKGLQESLE